MPEKKLSFFTWAVIPLGLQKTANRYLQNFENQGIITGRVALAALQKIKLEEHHTPAKLVRTTSADFGLDNNAFVAEIIRRGVGLGLKLCRPEVALSLREQYMSQPTGETLWIATEPLDSKYGPGYFSAGNDSRGLWLCFGCGGGMNCWWGRMRRALLSPAVQEKIVSMKICECPWSRRGRDAVTVIFEKD